MTKWDREPSAGELRAPRPVDEQPTRHTRRRNTKLWCRGKVGVEHHLAVRVKREVASRRAQPHKYGRDDYRYLDRHARWCGWSWWLWRLYADNGGWYYWCAHDRFCTRCGKIFPLEATACPEFDQHPRPRISARQAEINHHLAVVAARSRSKR